MFYKIVSIDENVNDSNKSQRWTGFKATNLEYDTDNSSRNIGNYYDQLVKWRRGGWTAPLK
ncbi:MAG: hypothetical protein KKA19_06365 [Candidatus Margulisbacteria bacterium]|nr:hypothetical protein [Candidatus Margulisiibacteriota bacterium]